MIIVLIRGMAAALALLFPIIADSDVLAQPFEGSAKLARAPTPDFVQERKTPAKFTLTANTETGVNILALDIQHDATVADQPYYVRTVAEATSGRGAEALSYLNVPFRSQSQTVELNHLRITRAGVTEDRSERVFASFAQREEQAESSVITGLVTAMIRIDDIRSGDILDLAYTIRGSHPAFPDRDVRMFPTLFEADIEQYSIRTIWPGEVATSSLRKEIKIKETIAGSRRIVTVGPMPLRRADILSKFELANPLTAFLTVSNFENWRAVAEWGTELYKERAPLSHDTITSIMGNADNLEDKIIAALRFTQNEIKYSAILLGDGGYRPKSAEETLRARFGDCKAKALLFISLLDTIGVKGVPVLVNAANGFNLDRYAPSPLAFDHVVVRFELNGRAYWVDPTIIRQGGPLANITMPDYGYTLALDGSAADLTLEAPARSSGIDVEVSTEFDLSKGALPAKAKSKYTLRGLAADANRVIYEYLGEKEYVKAFAALHAKYGSAKVDQSLYRDDFEQNTITVEFTATLDSPFSNPDKDRKRHFKFTPFGLPTKIQDFGGEIPSTAQRLEMPIRSSQALTVILPENFRFSLPPIETDVDSPAFRFHAKGEQTDQRYVLNYKYEPTASAIQPTDFRRVVEANETMHEAAEYHLWIRSPQGGADEGPDPKSVLPTLDIALPEIK